MAEKLLKGYSIDAGGYAYKPNKKLNVWTASDGSVIRKDLLGFLLDYTEIDFNIDGAEWGDFFWVELIAPEKEPHGQEEYEYGKMRGDYEREEEPKKTKLTKTNVKPKAKTSSKPAKVFKNMKEFSRWFNTHNEKVDAEIRNLSDKKVQVGNKIFNSLYDVE